MTRITDQDRALFEAGIKLGAMYHQFTGSPVSPNTAESLERAIEGSISLQPYVRKISVSIDREMVKKRLNDFGYCELDGRMLTVTAIIEFGTAVVYAGMKYDEDADYPMMFLQRIEVR